jgi:hypothetical protein
MKRHLLALVACALVAGCGGATTSSADPRAAAIQKYLDATPNLPYAPVANGPECAGPGRPSPALYRTVPGAHVRAQPVQRESDGSIVRCYTVTWDASVPVAMRALCAMCGSTPQTPFGRFVVDKVGEEQSGPLGIKVTPYTAHFVPNSVGEHLIAVKLASRPNDISDGQAALLKDANGNWVVQ